MSRFDYVKYDELASKTQSQFKEAFEALERMINTLGNSRATSIAHTKVEEAYMWVGKSIRDAQLTRDPATPLNESREPAPSSQL